MKQKKWIFSVHDLFTVDKINTIIDQFAAVVGI